MRRIIEVVKVGAAYCYARGSEGVHRLAVERSFYFR